MVALQVQEKPWIGHSIPFSSGQGYLCSDPTRICPDWSWGLVKRKYSLPVLYSLAKSLDQQLLALGGTLWDNSSSYLVGLTVKTVSETRPLVVVCEGKESPPLFSMKLFRSSSTEVLLNSGCESSEIWKVADVQSKKVPLLPAPFSDLFPVWACYRVERKQVISPS